MIVIALGCSTLNFVQNIAWIFQLVDLLILDVAIYFLRQR